MCLEINLFYVPDAIYALEIDISYVFLAPASHSFAAVQAAVATRVTIKKLKDISTRR